jgi:hypothetical protein
MNDQDQPNPLDITGITNPISNMKPPMSLGFYKNVCDWFSGLALS